MNYPELEKRLDALISDSPAAVSALANAASLLYESIPDVSWVGFYVERNGELVLGPFQGKTACILIPPGKGVCQTALTGNRTVSVADVHSFPGHIACDPLSRSELVVPIRLCGKAVAVLDVDSYTPGRFTDEDAAGVERLAYVVEREVGDRISGIL